MVDLLGFIIQVLKWAVVCALIAYMLISAVTLATHVGYSFVGLSDIAETAHSDTLTPNQMFAMLDVNGWGAMGDVSGWLIAFAGVIPAFWIAQWIWKGVKSVVSK